MFAVDAVRRYSNDVMPGGFILETEPKPGRIVVAIGDCFFGFNGEDAPVFNGVEDMVPEGWESSIIINFRNGSLLASISFARKQPEVANLRRGTAIS
jgi:hypothetical protein